MFLALDFALSSHRVNTNVKLHHQVLVWCCECGHVIQSSTIVYDNTNCLFARLQCERLQVVDCNDRNTCDYCTSVSDLIIILK